MAKLTLAMESVIGYLSDDWEFGCSGGMIPYYWLQERLGHGGEHFSLHTATAEGLLARRLLVQAGRAPGLGTKWLLKTEHIGAQSASS